MMADKEHPMNEGLKANQDIKNELNKPDGVIIVPPIDYAERLFRLEQLKHKRDEARVEIDLATTQHAQHYMKTYIAANDKIIEINAQISKLLEDE